jgi:hypothetical protein
MKFFHNDKVSLGWAIIVEIAVHALFAFQAFLLGGFLGEIALTVVFGSLGPIIGAWALAIFIFGSAFQAFVLGEYMREHVESFERTAKGNGSYIRSWAQVRWLVGIIEVCSLGFRCYTILVAGNFVQAVIVLVMGIVALWYAFAQAKVIHASVNRPVEYDVVRARQTVGRDLVGNMLDLVGKMTIDEKARVYQGDLTAIQEAQDRELEARDGKVRETEEKRQRAKRQEQEQEQEHAAAQDIVNKLLGGSNGHRPLL